MSFSMDDAILNACYTCPSNIQVTSVVLRCVEGKYIGVSSKQCVYAYIEASTVNYSEKINAFNSS